MQRVLIIGSSGAGKSTFAIQLAAFTGLPLIHLDAQFWQAGWRETPRDLWKERVAELVRGDRWIMDGNYGGTMAPRIAAADTVILLALPRIQCLYRVIKRGVRGRGKPRIDLHPGCNEQLPDLAFLRWIWAYPRKSLPRVLELLRGQENTKSIVILRSSADVAHYLASRA